MPAVGLEPTRVISSTDFESVTSTNSIIPACSIDGCIIIYLPVKGKGYFIIAGKRKLSGDIYPINAVEY